MPCYEYRGKRPKVAADAWVAPTAVLIGDVTVHSGASIWWGTVLRADSNRIEIGERSNVQDLCVFHTDRDHPVILGADVTVGHMAMVHSSIVGPHVLIGLSAALAGKNEVGAGSIVGAGAVLPEGFKVGERSLVVGVPARVVRQLGSEHERWTHGAAEAYVGYAREYRTLVREVAPDPL